MPANISNVIAVSATTKGDKKASFSNYGYMLDVAAPGVSILSLKKGTVGYYYASGTSMACPHVSGVAALIIGLNPGASNVDVRNHLRATADDIGSYGFDSKFGYGRVNAYEACKTTLKTSPPPTPEPGPGPGPLPGGLNINLGLEEWIVVGRGGFNGSPIVGIYGWAFYEDNGVPVDTYFDYYKIDAIPPKGSHGDTLQIARSIVPASDIHSVTPLVNWDTTDPFDTLDGHWTIVLTAYDTAGNSRTLSRHITLNNYNSMPWPPYIIWSSKKVPLGEETVPFIVSLGEIVEFYVGAEDPDSPDYPIGDSESDWGDLTYAMSADPFATEASLNNVTGYFNWTPESEDSYDFHFTITDGEGYSCNGSVNIMVYGVTGVPNTPLNLHVESIGPEEIRLSWDDNSDNTNGFNIYRDNALLTKVESNIREFTDRDLTPGITYAYKISAFNTEESSTTDTIECTTWPTVPSDLNANTTPGVVELAWSSASGNFDGYVIERIGDNGSFSEFFVDAASISYNDSTITPGAAYTYKIHAYKNGTEGTVRSDGASYAGVTPNGPVVPLFSLMLKADLNGTGQDEIIIDFGQLEGADKNGLWIRHADGTWEDIHGMSPELIVTGDLDADGSNEIIADFGEEHGIWVKHQAGTWENIYDLSPDAMLVGDINADDNDELIADFGEDYGICVRLPDGTWGNIHGLSPKSMLTADLDGTGKDEIVIDFGDEHGIWVLYDDSSWSNIYGRSVNSIVAGDLDANGSDELIINFGAHKGVWIRHDTGTLEYLHGISPAVVKAADLNSNGADEIIIDFGSSDGIWVRYDTGDWAYMHARSPESMITADLDGDGTDELVTDLGSYNGLWARSDDNTWSYIYGIN